MFRKASLFALGVVAVYSIGANAEEWRFSIGANYRTFDDIDYKAHSFSNGTPITLPNGSLATFPDYVNGMIVNGNSGVTLTVLDGAAQAPQNLPGGNALLTVQPSSEIFMDRIHFGKSGADTDDGWGLVLGASRTLEEGADIRWDLDWSFATATSSDDRRYSRTGTTDTITAFDSVGIPNGDPNTPDTQVFASSAIVTATTAGSLFTTGTIDFDYDLEAYTLGVGVSANWANEHFQWSLGAGPTLTIGDLDVRRVNTIIAGPASLDIAPGTVLDRQTINDGDDDFIFGLYGNIAIGVNVTESVALSLQYRYDVGFSDLSTRLADQPLDGSSAQLRLVFTY